jgi:mitotic-spindle organizing protein 1
MTQDEPKQLQDKETMDALLDISTLLNTGLDRKSLSVCVDLLETGVNPQALAIVVKELNKS